MKSVTTFLLWLGLLGIMPALAQKNTLSFGVFGMPVDGATLALGNVAYFRQWSPQHNFGLKGMFITDAIGHKSGEGQLTLFNIDLVHRWTFGKAGRRSAWNIDAGISSAWTAEKIPPVSNWAICPTGMTQKQIEELEKYYHEVLAVWRVEHDNFPGVIAAANWAYRVSPHFYLGTGLGLNVYFATKEGWAFLPSPQVNAAYAF